MRTLLASSQNSKENWLEGREQEGRGLEDQVSQWTRLCELTIPLAIENFLKESSDQHPTIPAEILELEKKLSEPVRVHNDDKLRRQKLKQQKAAGVRPSLDKEETKGKVHRQETSEEVDSSSASLELRVAFSKLTVREEPAPANREPAHVIICKKLSEKLVEFPLLAAWYQRIQEVPRVKTTASQCGIQFLHLPELQTTSNEQQPSLDEVPCVEEQNDPSFIGGPRPTMTKLMPSDETMKQMVQLITEDIKAGPKFDVS
ncbi:hypothetical protein J1605_011602 [Eschrichtius robustus]|uniref:Uncharacterized protein n=1 Tax=Eschrichtius robustus TaxID=9764 RepID=A0AB34GML9_ESCRO|nr:hypothetical protein J1605_011602 [Eschrichtius robustus]